jgi:hypothetical protein
MLMKSVSATAKGSTKRLLSKAFLRRRTSVRRSRNIEAEMQPVTIGDANHETTIGTTLFFNQFGGGEEQGGAAKRRRWWAMEARGRPPTSFLGRKKTFFAHPENGGICPGAGEDQFTALGPPQTRLNPIIPPIMLFFEVKTVGKR